jgi:regulation of enolase protein 1 (concanavalin A-like superfamily)
MTVPCAVESIHVKQSDCRKSKLFLGTHVGEEVTVWTFVQYRYKSFELDHYVISLIGSGFWYRKTKIENNDQDYLYSIVFTHGTFTRLLRTPFR